MAAQAGLCMVPRTIIYRDHKVRSVAWNRTQQRSRLEQYTDQKQWLLPISENKDRLDKNERGISQRYMSQCAPKGLNLG